MPDQERLVADSRVALAQLSVHGERIVPWSVSARCEILPVAYTDGRIVTLARHSAATAAVPGWWEELLPGQHPTQVVVDALIRELREVFDQATSVVHSTSWRYENQYLVLSYLAVLQPQVPLASDPGGFVLQPMHNLPAGAARTGDPAAIPVLDVLAHGLRHLAMLRVSDPMVAETLADCWHELLTAWHPAPAGLLPSRPVPGLRGAG